MDSIKTVGVLGAGTMGNGIAQVFARAGYKVMLYDVDQAPLDRGMATIKKNLEREIKKGKLDEAERERVWQRLVPVTEMSAIAGVDFLVEAVPEKMEIKKAVVSVVGRLLREEVVMASNTSSISIAVLGEFSGRADRFVGMHFMNPVPMMSLVEVVRGPQTSEATIQATMQLAQALGKKPVAVSDAPGF